MRVTGNGVKNTGPAEGECSGTIATGPLPELGWRTGAGVNGKFKVSTFELGPDVIAPAVNLYCSLTSMYVPVIDFNNC